MRVKLPVLMEGKIELREGDSKTKKSNKEVRESFEKILRGKREKKTEKVNVSKLLLKEKKIKQLEKRGAKKDDEVLIKSKNIKKSSGIKNGKNKNEDKSIKKEKKKSKKTELNVKTRDVNLSIFFSENGIKKKSIVNVKMINANMVNNNNKDKVMMKKNVIDKNINKEKLNIQKEKIEQKKIKLKSNFNNEDLKVRVEQNKAQSIKKRDLNNSKSSFFNKSHTKFVDLKKELKDFALKENIGVIFKPPFSGNPQIRDLLLYINRELKTNFNLFQNQLFDIFNNIKVKNINGNYFVSMKLFPEDLGKIDIYLKKTGDLIEGHIIVQSESIKSLLDGRIWEIKNLLNNGNINNNSSLTNINVIVDNSGSGRKEYEQFDGLLKRNVILSDKNAFQEAEENSNMEKVEIGKLMVVSYLGRRINCYL